MTEFSFKPKERLHKRSEFIHIYRKGVPYESQHFKVAVLPNTLGWRRLGVTVSKKVGNAVQRNKIKRTVREYFRTHQQMLNGNWDINIIAKKQAATLAYTDAQTALGDIFQRLSPPKRRTPV